MKTIFSRRGYHWVWMIMFGDQVMASGKSHHQKEARDAAKEARKTIPKFPKL